MSAPLVTRVTVGSAASRAGLSVGDHLVSLNGQKPRDVIEFHQLVDTEELELEVARAGQAVPERITVTKRAEEPLGLEVSSPVFDRIRTCDNHCSFCFIYQLPKGMRKSLYLKDDDYRLSFLYGNFTTLTRFTELDAERVLEGRLGPLYVSIHSTDPELRATLLRNPRGATSLRWLKVLLAGGIEVHGQIVVCPGVNDGAALETTLLGILDEYAALKSVGVVPLGVSVHSNEPEMRPHTTAEARAVVETVEEWQGIYQRALGRRLAFAADEYFLLAERPFPAAERYEGYPQHENGIGMVRAFERAFHGDEASALGVHRGFFAAVDEAPAVGYRAPHLLSGDEPPPSDGAASVAVVTGSYGAMVLRPLLEDSGHGDVRIVEVENRFFGGNIGVAGLLTGADLARVLASQPVGDRYFLPDACLSEGRFLDGLTVADLPRTVEVLGSDGASLRHVLDRVPAIVG